jgi:hypothetical protein
MIDIVCILFKPEGKGLPKFSQGYSEIWVDKLAQAIARHTTQKYRLICLVDEFYEFEEEVDQVQLKTNESGWGCVMETFRPDLGENQRFVLGLDTIIKDNIDEILDWRGKVGLLTDPNYPDTICNGVGSYSPEFCDFIFYEWQRKEKYGERILYNGRISEMQFLRLLANDATRLNEVFPNQIQSYKCHWLKEPEKREEASIVYFHGNPKPPFVHTDLLAEW